MTHAGLAVLIAAFFLLMGGGTGAFADLRAPAATLPAATRNLAFVLAFLGFGAKAGIIPLHVWLPRAHPAAPSHVSALMSGVMLKLGIYGLLRVGLDLLGGGPAWWGGLVLAAGALSALLGVLYALMEHDLKRLLAYSSVENIGIILMGMGAGFVFHSYGLMALATLGFVGGAVPHHQPRRVQGAALPGRRLGAARHAHAQHGRDGRADQADALDCALLPDRRGRHLGAAAAQWLRLRVAGLPGAAGGRESCPRPKSPC